jgi:hypothetical protein
VVDLQGDEVARRFAVWPEPALAGHEPHVFELLEGLANRPLSEFHFGRQRFLRRPGLIGFRVGIGGKRRQDSLGDAVANNNRSDPTNRVVAHNRPLFG